MSRPLVPSRPRKAVLAVGEDNPEMELLRSAIEAADYDVLCAPDGPTALRLVPRCLRQIHLVIANLDMQPMTGMQLATEIKLAGAHIPVLLLCTDEAPETAVGCWFLTKPLRPRVLIQTVNKICGREECPKIRPPSSAAAAKSKIL